MPRMTAAEADELLDGQPLVPAMAGSIPEIKALRERCLAEGIPATIGCPGGKSCGPRTHLLVEENELPRLAQLLSSDWADHVEREGLAPVELTASTDGDEPPCPACGTAAPLVKGACSDCGLQLE